MKGKCAGLSHAGRRGQRWEQKAVWSSGPNSWLMFTVHQHLPNCYFSGRCYNSFVQLQEACGCLDMGSFTDGHPEASSKASMLSYWRIYSQSTNNNSNYVSIPSTKILSMFLVTAGGFISVDACEGEPPNGSLTSLIIRIWTQLNVYTRQRTFSKCRMDILNSLPFLFIGNWWSPNS